MAKAKTKTAEFIEEAQEQTDRACEQDSKRVRRLILDPRDHMEAARAMVAARYRDGNDRRMLHRYRGAFYHWTGSHYRESNDEAINAEVWSFLDGALKLDSDGKLVPFKPHKTAVTNLVEALKSVCQIDADGDAPFWLGTTDDVRPAPREIFACGNGLLHVPSGKLLPATPEFFGLNASDVVFNPKAPAPRRWLKFLKELHGIDHQSVEAEQEAFGYALTPDTSQQKIMLMVGPKRGGKGTIARVLTALLGSSAVAAPTIGSLSTQFGLWPLIGRNLAIISDARVGAKTDKAAIVERLLSISGEDDITVDRKFLSAWKGRLSVRFWIMTNELPSFSDGSGALASRFVVIVLTKSFYGREDLGLTEKLTAELPGILNWAIDGYRRLHERGHFVQPESSTEAIEAIETLASPARAFVGEVCEVGVGHRVKTDTLYAAWRDWCGAHGLDPKSEQWFGRDLHAVVPSIKVVRPRGKDGGQTRFYEGIRQVRDVAM